MCIIKKMRILIQPEQKLKKAKFDNSPCKVKEKSSKSKFVFDFQFYQKLFLIFLASFTFLIFPESPKNSEILCKKYHSIDACIVW